VVEITPTHNDGEINEGVLKSGESVVYVHGVPSFSFAPSATLGCALSGESSEVGLG
jgi:hypothetical protein